MRARTTSQIDWWHARLTDVSLGGHASGCRLISWYWFSMMQSHRDVVVRVLVWGFVVVPGFVCMHPCRWWSFHRGCRNKWSGSRTRFPRSTFSLCEGIRWEFFSRRFLWVLLQYLSVRQFLHQLWCVHDLGRIQSLGGPSDVFYLLLEKFLHNVFEHPES